ncbi:MAG TPA: glycosyltransferase family 39 protein, partial [Candidatus Kryptonia bacterium]|nr:glycosyltransferase family 39 protein [Candidatus Kryptonia bacterium]
MAAANDNDGLNGGPRVGARVIGVAIAIAFGALGYRNHFTPELPWWQWLGPWVAGAAVLTESLAGERAPAESSARRGARRFAGAVALMAAAAAVVWQPQAGREVATGTAVVIAVVAFFLARWVPFSTADVSSLLATQPDAAPEPSTRIRAVLLTVASLVAGVAAAALNHTNHLAAFVVWLASLVLFAAAMWRRGPKSSPPTRWVSAGGPELSPRSAALALLLVLLLALALRVTFLRDVPALIDPDEGRQGRWAERIWHDGFPDAFGIGWNVFPHLSYLTEYVWVQALGTSNANLRLSAATVGTLSLVPVFFWVRRWWGNVIALLAVLILAVNREHIAWSRLALNNIQQVLVAALMLAAFARLLRTRRAIDWVWFGYAVGLAFHTYHSAKLFPALLAGVALLFAIGMRGFARRYAPGALVGVLAFVLCFGPLAVTIYENWNYFYNGTSNRVDLAQLTDAYHRGDVTQVRDYLGR